MTQLDAIITEALHGAPEKALHDLEAYLEPFTGPIPPDEARVSLWVKNACAIFYLLRYVELARYREDGHKRVDLLRKAAALIPEPVDLEA